MIYVSDNQGGRMMKTKEEIKGYLTAEEQKMPLECMLLQSVMGIQTCKNKGEVKDILLQIYLIGQNRAIKKAKEEGRGNIIKEIEEMNVYKGIGKVKIWRMGNDQVCYETQEYIVKKLKTNKEEE